MKPYLYTRLCDRDLSASPDIPEKLAGINWSSLYEYDKESITNVLVDFLSRENKYSQVVPGDVYHDFHVGLAQRHFGTEYGKLASSYANPIVATRTNVLYLLRKVLTDSSFKPLRKKIKHINQLAYYMLKINCFELSPNVDQSKDLFDSETLLKVVSSYFQYNFITGKGKLYISELMRNHAMLEELIKTQEGAEAESLFVLNEGISPIEKVEIGYLVYVFLYKAYEEDNFSSTIDFDWFDSTFGETAGQGISSVFRHFFDSFNYTTPLHSDTLENLYDLSLIWSHPIRKLSDRRFQVLDPAIFIEILFKNTFVAFESYFLNDPKMRGEKKNLDLRQKALGTVFESQVKSILTDLSDFESLAAKDKTGNEITDHILHSSGKTVFVEIKSGYLPIGRLASDFNESTLISLLKKFGYQYPGFSEYGKLPRNERKGILQLIHLFCKLSQHDRTDDFGPDSETIMKSNRYFGLVVVQDNALSVGGLNQLIYQVNKNHVSGSSGVQFSCPFIVHVSDFQKIIHGNIKPLEAIEGYSSALEAGEIYDFNDYIKFRYDDPRETDDTTFPIFAEKIMKKHIK